MSEKNTPENPGCRKNLNSTAFSSSSVDTVIDRESSVVSDHSEFLSPVLRPASRNISRSLETLPTVLLSPIIGQPTGDRQADLSVSEVLEDSRELNNAAGPSRPSKRNFGTLDDHNAEGKRPAESDSEEETHEERPRRTRASNQRKAAREVDESVEDGMFGELFRGEKPAKDIAKEWMGKFEEQKTEAADDIFQLLIRSAGCKVNLTTELMDKPLQEILKILTLSLENEDEVFPLIRPGIKWTRFQQMFADFFYNWATLMGKALVFEEAFTEGFNDLILAMTENKVRTFRHTATVAVIKIMSAMVDAQLSIFIKIGDKKRQMEAEQNKNASPYRINSLRASEMSLEQDFEEYKTLFEYYFTRVFIDRFRDVSPEIRDYCMTGLGLWIETFPQEYLEKKYLKLIDATLTDPDDRIRLRCLQILRPLYTKAELRDGLADFTSTCKSLLMNMVVHKNEEISAFAIRLITLVARSQKVLVSTDEDAIYLMVYATNRGQALAAAGFLAERLFALSEDSSNSPKKTASGKRRRPNTVHLRDLVDFFLESETPSHAAYLVDALIDNEPLIKDWPSITELLLEEPGPEEEALTDAHETALIRIMTCAVKQAATGIHPDGRDTKKRLTSKNIKRVESDKRHLTSHFMSVLPSLLSKYQMDEEKLATLLSIPIYFDLKLFHTNLQSNSLKLLLESLEKIISHSSSEEVQVSAVKTMEALCLNESLQSSTTDVSLLTVLDTLMENLSMSHQNFFQNKENEDDSINLREHMHKVANFSASFDLNKYDVWNSSYKIVKVVCGQRRNVPISIVENALSTCYYSLVWALKSTYICEPSEQDISEELVKSTVEEIQKRLKSFTIALQILLSPDFPTPLDLQHHSYRILCDTLIVFCKKDGDEFWKEELTWTPKDNLIAWIIQYLCNNVIETEDENDGAHSRRAEVTLFCKLLIFGVFDPQKAAGIFKYYPKLQQEFGDILKTTLQHIRKTNALGFSELLLQSVIQLYEDLAPSENFVPVHNLAQRFVLLYGLNTNIHHQCGLMELHRNGIFYAANPFPADGGRPPPHLPFLNVLSIFSNKLTKEKKWEVYRILNQSFDTSMTPSISVDDPNWSPLFQYRTSLGFDDTDSRSIETRTPIRQATPRANRRAKRLVLND